jgi:hypothetical protein
MHTCIYVQRACGCRWQGQGAAQPEWMDAPWNQACIRACWRLLLRRRLWPAVDGDGGSLALRKVARVRCGCDVRGGRGFEERRRGGREVATTYGRQPRRLAGSAGGVCRLSRGTAGRVQVVTWRRAAAAAAEERGACGASHAVRRVRAGGRRRMCHEEAEGQTEGHIKGNTVELQTWGRRVGSWRSVPSGRAVVCGWRGEATPWAAPAPGLGGLGGRMGVCARVTRPEP